MNLNYLIIELLSLDNPPPTTPTPHPPTPRSSSGVCQAKLATFANRSHSQTDGLAKLFRLKKSSRVMLTTNASIDDRLVNGQLGTIFDTKQESSGILSKIYVKFELRAEYSSKLVSTDASISMYNS